MVEDICESKENISNQQNGYFTQPQFYEKPILAQNQEIKLLKKQILKESQKFTQHFS
jgi:hypothetical protein